MKLWQSRYNSLCKLSQQDLRDISEEITQTYAPHDSHHQPELVLMPVDPINLYAYWNLKASGTDNIISHVDKQLALRIYSIPELSEHRNNSKLSFDIKVSGFQNQQKVHLPVAATTYSAVIGEINADNSFSPLATSDTIHVPREKPVATNSITDNENMLQLEQTQENNIVTDHAPRASQISESNINNNENLVQHGQVQKPISINEAQTEDAWYQACILKDFNGYGYDLVVYQNDSDAEFNNNLSRHGSNIQLSDTTTNTINKNTSSQGCLL